MRRRDIARYIPLIARHVRYVETLEWTLLARTKQVEDLEEALSQRMERVAIHESL